MDMTSLMYPRFQTTYGINEFLSFSTDKFLLQPSLVVQVDKEETRPKSGPKRKQQQNYIKSHVPISD